MDETPVAKILTGKVEVFDSAYWRGVVRPNAQFTPPTSTRPGSLHYVTSRGELECKAVHSVNDFQNFSVINFKSCLGIAGSTPPPLRQTSSLSPLAYAASKLWRLV